MDEMWMKFLLENQAGFPVEIQILMHAHESNGNVRNICKICRKTSGNEHGEVINRMDDRLAKIAKDGKANASRLQDLSGLQNVGWRKLDINIAGKAYWIKYRIRRRRAFVFHKNWRLRDAVRFSDKNLIRVMKLSSELKCNYR